MTQPGSNPQEVLREEILADARQQSEQILGKARQDAESLIAKAVAEAEKAHKERLDAARAEAARRKELILSTVPVEAGRRRSARIEALLQAIHDDAHERLLSRDGSDYRETLVVLSVDAVRRMNGNAFVVKLSPSDRASFGAGLAEEIARRDGRSPLTITLADDPSITGGGVIVQDVEGQHVWDNRLAARLERLWPQFRLQIAVQAGLVLVSKPGGTT